MDFPLQLWEKKSRVFEYGLLLCVSEEVSLSKVKGDLREGELERLADFFFSYFFPIFPLWTWMVNISWNLIGWEVDGTLQEKVAGCFQDLLPYIIFESIISSSSKWESLAGSFSVGNLDYREHNDEQHHRFMNLI